MGVWNTIVLAWGSSSSLVSTYFFVAKTYFHLNPSLPSPCFLLYPTESMKASFAIWAEHLLRIYLPSEKPTRLRNFSAAGVWDCALDMDLGNQPCFSRGLELDDPQRSCPTTTILLSCDVSHMP